MKSNVVNCKKNVINYERSAAMPGDNLDWICTIPAIYFHLLVAAQVNPSRGG